MQKRGFWVGLILIAFITLGCWVSPAVALTQEQQFFNEAWRIVNRAYIDETFNHQNWWLLRQQALKHPLKDRQATYAAIDKMLGTLGDPFTRLLKPDQYHSLQVNTSGELTGVGLQIALDEKTHTIEVIAPIEGSPAEQAGILPHDIILEIDGVSTTGLSLDDAAARMRGPIGSRVTLSVQRQSDQPAIPIQLVRDRISLNPVYADRRMNSNQEAVGYIRLSQFNANATSEVAHAISTLEKQGVSGYILDLRNNPGGLLQAGIEIARLWINTGTIVYTVNRQGILGSFDATQSALTDKPLIVLVNQGTASASEILAGALQDNGRALLVGEKTFGKGLIQSLFDLSDGSGLAITVAKYETPNHRDIHKQGIVPDKVVASELISRNQLATEVDDQYQVAVEMLTHPPVLADAA
jgi:carboxyl-terminal processing protease